MNKNNDFHILFKTLSDTLPYEYDGRLTDNGTAITLSKKDSDNTAYISSDDDDDIVIAIGHDDPNRGYFVEYETIHRPTEDEQIPVGSIAADIKHYL